MSAEQPIPKTVIEPEKHVLACFLHYNNNSNYQNALEEFKFLIESAGYSIERLFICFRIRVHNPEGFSF